MVYIQVFYLEEIKDLSKFKTQYYIYIYTYITYIYILYSYSYVLFIKR